MAKKITSIICPHCNSTVITYRATKGRILITSGAGIVLAVVGGVIGTGIGIVMGGSGIPATIPLAAIGLVVGSGLGYIISDKNMDNPKCPKCGKAICLGL